MKTDLTTITPEAFHAVRAAKNKHSWGRYATMKYIINRGVPFGLYRLACQLEAVK